MKIVLKIGAKSNSLSKEGTKILRLNMSLEMRVLVLDSFVMRNLRSPNNQETQFSKGLTKECTRLSIKSY
jgi:hypothetical protein